MQFWELGMLVRRRWLGVSEDVVNLLVDGLKSAIMDGTCSF